jgi:hypothetical protein
LEYRCKQCTRDAKTKRLLLNPLCTLCNQRPHQTRHQHCLECQRQRQKGKRTRVCSRCKTRPLATRSLCERCADTCPKCNNSPRAASSTWCRKCLNDSGQERRNRRRKQGIPNKKRTPEQQFKRRARAKVYMARLRGRIEPMPCEVCGHPIADAHHYKGYSPQHSLSVRWLCKLHHQALERWEKLVLTVEGKRIDGKAVA